MKKIILLLLLACSLSQARSILSGACENGAQRVSVQGVQSSTYVQRSYPSCTVNVYLTGTTTHAIIYSTFAGASKTNPFTAATDGYWYFWADDGQYDVVMSGGQIPTTITRYEGVGAATAGALLAANNLSDLVDFPTARTNLGLGGAAVLGVGTTAGTVAAGDDSRFPTAGQKSALVGSSGTPGSMNLYVTQNDSLLPTAGESAALVGSAGTPGSGNKYITQADVSTTSSTSLIPRSGVSGKLDTSWLDYTGQYATGSQPGFLSSANWTTFNNKQAAGDYITAAANLTTTDAIPYVSAAGVLSQETGFLRGHSGGSRSFRILANAGNNFADVQLNSGGGGGAGDNSTITFYRAAVLKWQIVTGVDTSDAFNLSNGTIFPLSISNTTGLITFGSGGALFSGDNLTWQFGSASTSAANIIQINSNNAGAQLNLNSTAGGGAFGQVYNTNGPLYITNNSASGSLVFRNASSTTRMVINSSGGLQLNAYTTGLLQTDSGGNVSNIVIPNADGTHTGYLTSGDWTTFSAKQAAGSYITALTGDVTAAGPGSVAATIANNAVSLAKMATMATASILGRNTAGTGNVEVLSTLPSAVQGNITAVGTLASGSIPYSLLTGVPVYNPIVLHILCTGTATTTTTLYIQQYGSNACTNTTETIAAGAEILAQHTGTVKNLRVRAAAAGATAFSGIVTLGLVSSGDTVVTCTVGTGTTCTDLTHTAAVTAGDRIYVRMDTGATETLANVLFTYEY